jgi:hypothetical protein
MTRRHLLQAAVIAPAALGGLFAERRTLFNGRDFTGWRHYGYGVWTVEAGDIVAKYDPERDGPGYMFTTEVFEDFTIELDFWISKGGNSGIFIRQPLRDISPRGDARPAHSPGDGVEVQIDYNDLPNPTGAIYNLQKPSRVVGGEERWNRCRIQCTGPRVQVWIDGELVNDFSGLVSPKGAIGFQMHGGGRHNHVVRFRNVQLI